jgi:hypothetical protein
MIIQAISGLVAFLSLMLCIFVLSKNRKSDNNISFSLLTLVSALWSCCNYLVGIFPFVFILQSSYALGMLTMALGINWVHVLTQNSLSKRAKLLLFSSTSVLIISIYTPNYIAKSYEKIDLGGSFIGTPGYGLYLLSIAFFVYSFVILYRLYGSICTENNRNNKLQYLYVFIGALCSIFVTALTSFILPSFSIFIFMGQDSLGFLIFLTFIAYTITKNHLFGIKVILLELAFTGLWSVLLLRILTASDLQQALVALGILVSSIVFGIILIRTVIQEILLRDRVEKLTLELKTAYASAGMPHDAQHALVSKDDMQLPPLHPRT